MFVSVLLSLLFCLSFSKKYSSIKTLSEQGVNIHFRGTPPAGITTQISNAYRVARMDFSWDAIETKQGIYNFTLYDQLVDSFLSANPEPIRAYFILDYSNPLYNNNLPPNTAESIDAFVNFSIASITHYTSNKYENISLPIIWEMWNEPNGGFWPPQPNATAYSNLANAVGRAIRSNSNKDVANAIYIGPACSGIGM